MVQASVGRAVEGVGEALRGPLGGDEGGLGGALAQRGQSSLSLNLVWKTKF